MTGRASSHVLAAPAPAPVADLYLESFLTPFRVWLNDPEAVEIMINRPGEAWVEKVGASAPHCEAAPHITYELLQRLSEQIARINHQAINRFHPLMSASLPGGERVQIVAPPTSGRDWALAIRRHQITEARVADFLPRPGAEAAGPADDPDVRFHEWRAAGDHEALLRHAVLDRQNTLLSRGTSPGKTTLLNACPRFIPKTDRIITIEDARELSIPQPNHLSLIAVKGELGEARVNVADLLQAALRMRPDRIILGEIRGTEALAFLRAINTGHPGSISTLHANSPKLALEQLALMVLEAGFPLSREATLDYLTTAIDLIVQLGRTPQGRVITDIVRATELREG